MRSFPFLILAALFLGSFAVSCIFKPEKDPVAPELGNYSKDLGHPDSLLNDLQVSYRRKEIEPYATLLAPEFIFKFLEEDLTPEIPLGFWNKDEDSTGTKGLFESTQVTNIRIDLTWFNYEAAFTSNGQLAQRTIISTNLDVDLAQGDVTFRVDGDSQFFFFRQGSAEAGEDETRWYISEWQDQGPSSGAPKDQAVPTSDRPGRNIIRVTMGELRERLAELELSQPIESVGGDS